MLRFPNAKINIGLFITGKRTDGYHDLETVFYPVQPTDALELIAPATETSLQVTGLEVAGEMKNNLAWKAWALLQRDFPDRVAPLHIFLHKVIPMGGGMGGGSSDGAFMLCMLNDHFHLGLDTAALERYALQLGSDCPFFVRNQPAFAAGRGELLQPVPLDLSAYTIQVICPGIHVSTALAFKGVKPAAAAFDLRSLHEQPLSSWRDTVLNDFEPSVFGAHPELKAIKESLYRQGALYASMSGSGSAIYGIFEKGHKARPETTLPFTEFLSESDEL